MKYCLHCTKLLAPKRSNESAGSYAKRKFCSHKCSATYHTRASRLRWNGTYEKQPNIRETIRAATEAEWLALNHGPTICPPRYAAPVEHYTHVSTRSGRR